MTDTATTDRSATNGSQGLNKTSVRGTKRPNNQVVGGSQSNLTKVQNDYSADSSAIPWSRLRVNKPFSPNPNGIPLCLKVSASSYIEVWSGSRHSRIGEGMVYPCFK